MQYIQFLWFFFSFFLECNKIIFLAVLKLIFSNYLHGGSQFNVGLNLLTVTTGSFLTAYSTSTISVSYCLGIDVVCREIMEVIGSFHWASIQNCVLAGFAFSCNCSEMSVLSIRISGMKALQGSDSLIKIITVGS